MMTDEALGERELTAWRTCIRMLEMLRVRLEQRLQADSGLSVADYSVLSVLAEAPGGRMRLYELGQATAWEKSRLHHQLTRMSKRGLVDRERCGSRGIEAAITAHGLAVVREAAPCHARVVRQAFVDCLSSAELDQFGELSGIIVRKLEADG